jgi:hypothetical protein
LSAVAPPESFGGDNLTRPASLRPCALARAPQTGADRLSDVVRLELGDGGKDQHLKPAGYGRRIQPLRQTRFSVWARVLG